MHGGGSVCRCRVERVSALRRILVQEADVLGEQTSYYLLDESDRPSAGYGVEVRRGKERAAARRLSFSGERVWRLAEMLARGSVTSWALSDVIEDWLAR